MAREGDGSYAEQSGERSVGRDSDGVVRHALRQFRAVSNHNVVRTTRFGLLRGCASKEQSSRGEHGTAWHSTAQEAGTVDKAGCTDAHQFAVLVVENEEDDRCAFFEQSERAVLQRTATVPLRVTVTDLFNLQSTCLSTNNTQHIGSGQIRSRHMFTSPHIKQSQRERKREREGAGGRIPS
jgi:hypothetical protein